MKKFWIGLIAVGLLSIAAAQTASTSGSGSATASAGPGQASAGAGVSQNVQAPGASTGANATGSAQVSGEQRTRSGEPKEKRAPESEAHGKSNANAAGSAMLSEGSTVHTELTHSLDAKKCKPGDQVTARVTEDVKSNGKVVVHRGSKVMGHVTEVQARDKEHADSRLGIAFDKIVMKDGEEMSFNGAVQAIAPPASVLASAAAEQSAGLDAGAPMRGGPRASGGGGGGLGLGGVTGGAVSTVGATTGAVTSTAGGVASTAGSVTGAADASVRGAAGGLNAQGMLTSTSRGVVGLQGLTLNSATAGSAQGSLITCPKQNVRLDSGTQVLLRAAGSAQ